MLTFEEWKKKKGGQLPSQEGQQNPSLKGGLSFKEWRKQRIEPSPYSGDAVTRMQKSMMPDAEVPKVHAIPKDVQDWNKMSFGEKASATVREIPNTIGNHLKGVGRALGQDQTPISQKDTPWEERNFLQKAQATASFVPATITRNVLNAGIKTAQSGMGVAGFLGADLNKQVQAVAEYRAEYDKGLSPQSYNEGDNIFDNPDLLLNPEYYLRNVVEQIPNLAVMMKTKGLGEGVLELGSAFGERMEKGETDNYDRLYAGTVGVINGVLGKIGFNTLFKKNPALKGVVNEVLHPAIQKAVGAVVGTGTEMGTEYIQEAVPTIATKVMYDEGGLWREVLTEAHSQGKAGASAAGIISAPLSVANAISHDQTMETLGGAPRKDGEQLPGEEKPITDKKELSEKPKEPQQKEIPEKEALSENGARLFDALANDSKKDIKRFGERASVKDLDEIVRIADTMEQQGNVVVSEMVREEISNIKQARTERIQEASREVAGGKSIEEATKDMPVEDKKTVIQFVERASKNKKFKGKLNNQTKEIETARKEQVDLREQKRELLARKAQTEVVQERKEIQEMIDNIDARRKPEYDKDDFEAVVTRFARESKDKKEFLLKVSESVGRDLTKEEFAEEGRVFLQKNKVNNLDEYYDARKEGRVQSKKGDSRTKRERKEIEAAYKENVIFKENPEKTQTQLTVDVLPVGDAFDVSFSINAGKDKTTKPFTHKGRYKTRQEALEGAKKEINTWLSSRFNNATEETDMKALDAVYKAINNTSIQKTENVSKENIQSNINTQGKDVTAGKLSQKKRNEMDLSEEAKKYESAAEFVRAHSQADLMDLSDPAKHRFGRLFEDGVDENTGRYMDTKYVSDVYGKRGNNELSYQKDARVPDVSSPEELVTIYRGTRKAQKEMLPGDFVSFSREYALSHNEGEKLLTKQVPAKDVVFQGNDFHEWIYSPESIRGKKYSGGLTSLWEKATGKAADDPYTSFLKNNREKYQTVDDWVENMKASGKTRSQLEKIWEEANGDNPSAALNSMAYTESRVELMDSDFLIEKFQELQSELKPEIQAALSLSIADRILLGENEANASYRNGVVKIARQMYMDRSKDPDIQTRYLLTHETRHFLMDEMLSEFDLFKLRKWYQGLSERDRMAIYGGYIGMTENQWDALSDKKKSDLQHNAKIYTQYKSYYDKAVRDGKLLEADAELEMAKETANWAMDDEYIQTLEGENRTLFEKIQEYLRMLVDLLREIVGASGVKSKPSDALWNDVRKSLNSMFREHPGKIKPQNPDRYARFVANKQKQTKEDTVGLLPKMTPVEAMATAKSEVRSHAVTKRLKDALTTKILKKLRGKERVSKQFISDLTNSPDVRQVERELIRETIEQFSGKKIDVGEFTSAVEMQLLPLRAKIRSKSTKIAGRTPRYEHVTLIESQRGDVANYYEKVYESPIKTSSGEVHFIGGGYKNYFAHSRIEELPDPVNEQSFSDIGSSTPSEGKTRRVIEIQSDLFQKGRVDEERKIKTRLGTYDGTYRKDIFDIYTEESIVENGKAMRKIGFSEKEISKTLKEQRRLMKEQRARDKDLERLQPYRNTWHERIIREEVRQAILDGKERLLFPTGPTAMKIEGLGQQNTFWGLRLDNLEVGKTISKRSPAYTQPRHEWIITDVLGNGKFKAVQKQSFDRLSEGYLGKKLNFEETIQRMRSQDYDYTETFDISGKVDSSNPIYKFYDKDVRKFLNRVYGAKEIEDAQGVTWMEVDLHDGMLDDSVEAFALSGGRTTAQKARRFAAITERREELLRARKSREKGFLDSESGREFALKLNIETEKYQGPNPNVVQGIRNNPYFKKEGDIKDAMGEGYLMEKNGRYVVAEAKKLSHYTKRGYRTEIEIGTIASANGFDNGYEYLKDQIRRSEAKPMKLETAVRRHLLVNDPVYAKLEDEIDKKVEQLESAKTDKSAYLLGVRVGSNVMRDKMKIHLRKYQTRKQKARAVKEFFNLSDQTFKKIGGRRDMQTMTEKEFQGFLNHLQQQAEREVVRSQARELVLAQIHEKELKKTENLRRAMKLPPIDKMTAEQLREFDRALEDSHYGDEFVTQRQLETVKNTDLKGVKTIREVRERLAREIGMPVKELGKIRVSEFDRLRYDTALAEKNPFYKMMVDVTNASILDSEAVYLEVEKEANKLIKAARKSRKRSLADHLVPKDERIFKYLESSNKEKIAKNMTTEEIVAAEFIRSQYEQMRDYLIDNQMMDKYRENYITHFRKGFLESLRDDGIVKAFKNVLKQQKEDEAAFNILSGDTGEILPLEKFFQFTLQRKGGLEPTKNVAAAFLAYKRAFEKKRALDAIMPKIDMYVYAISPKKKTPRGLFMDRSLKSFYNEWMNTKKGRVHDMGSMLKQGGRVDISIRMANAFVTILDLGLSIPGGIAANVGEQAVDYVALGAKRYTKGTIRMNTKKGKAIIQKYQNFIGRNPWGELADARLNVGDRLMHGIFILFRDAQVRANKQYFLGALSEGEWESGEVSKSRLAEMKRDMGRWRVVDGASSVLGSTSIGKTFTKYKTWAVPIARTTTKNITTLTKMLKKDGIEAIQSREGAELFRSTIVIGTLALIVYSIASSDEDRDRNKTFIEKIVDKSIRDFMSTIGALDPKFWLGVPRLLDFLQDLGSAVHSTILLEEYKTSGDGYDKGDLKGPRQLQQQFTPTSVRQFIHEE